MTEFFTVKQIDNSRLMRPRAPNRLQDCLRLVFLGGMLALCAFLYAWQHFQTIQLRFELEMISFRRSACKMTGKAYVDGNLVAGADFMAMVMDR